MDPMQASCKLDLSTLGYYKTCLFNVLAFEVRTFPKCPKNGQFSYFWKSFLNDMISTIHWINATIINYQLSIKRSALEKKMVEQKH